MRQEKLQTRPQQQRTAPWRNQVGRKRKGQLQPQDWWWSALRLSGLKNSHTKKWLSLPLLPWKAEWPVLISLAACTALQMLQLAYIGIHRPLRLQAAMRNSCFSLEMLSLTTRSTTGVLQSHSLFESWRGLSVDERHDTSKRRLNHINTSQLFSSSTSGMVPFHIQNLYPRHWAATLLAVLQYPPKWQQFPDISRRLHFGSNWYHPHALGRSKCGKSHIEPQQKREINFVQPVQIDSNHFNLRKLYKAMSSGANFGQYPKNRTLLYIVYAQFMMFSGCIE